MKIEVKEKQFQPVTITLESQAELDVLWALLNVNHKDFRESAEFVNLPCIRAEEAILIYGKMWHDIDNICKTKS